MSDTCPCCGQPVTIHSSDEGTHCYTAPAPQLWLCVGDGEGAFICTGPLLWNKQDQIWGTNLAGVLYPVNVGLADDLNLLPGQAVGLSVGPVVQGGETDGA
jgi:hypothetical protein